MLSIEQIYILLHLKKAKVDYAKMMSKLTGMPVEKINECIKSLREMGFVERDGGSAIKRSRARFKKAHEVHKHHTYYKLTREGEIFSRKLAEELDRIIDGLTKKGTYNRLVELCRRGKLDYGDEELRKLGFITEKGRKTKFFEAFSYVAGLNFERI